MLVERASDCGLLVLQFPRVLEPLIETDRFDHGYLPYLRVVGTFFSDYHKQ